MKSIKILNGALIGIISLELAGVGALVNHISKKPNEFPRQDLPRQPKQRSQKHHRTPATKKVENKEGERYAVLINGNGDCERFKKAIDFAYNSLRRVGFSDANIYVLQSGDNQPGYVDSEATMVDLEKTFTELEERIKQSDIFLLYTTNHGEIDDESTLLLREEEITASEMKHLNDKINPNYTLAIFKQCYGEGFASEFGEGNSIGISAAGKGKISWGEYWEEKKGFTYYIFSAIGGEDPFGEKIDADLNDDGRISVEELFDYVAQNNPLTKYDRWDGETPQMYWQNADPAELYIRENDLETLIFE